MLGIKYEPLGQFPINVQSTASVPGIPSMPSIPGMPQLPSMPSIPGMPQLPSMPSIPGMPKLPSIQQLPSIPPIPGVPFQPDQLLQILNSPNPEQAAKAILNNFPIPGLPVPITAGQILDAAKSVAKTLAAGVEKVGDWLSGGPEKRERERAKWRDIKKVFNLAVYDKPLLIYSPEGLPSKAFINHFQSYLKDIKKWEQIRGKKQDDVPSWLFTRRGDASVDIRKLSSTKEAIEKANKTRIELALDPQWIIKAFSEYIADPNAQTRQKQAINEAIKKAKETARIRASAQQTQASQQARKRKVENDAVNWFLWVFAANPKLAIGKDNKPNFAPYADIIIGWMSKDANYDKDYAAGYIKYAINKIAFLGLAAPWAKELLDKTMKEAGEAPKKKKQAKKEAPKEKKQAKKEPKKTKEETIKRQEASKVAAKRQETARKIKAESKRLDEEIAKLRRQLKAG